MHAVLDTLVDRFRKAQDIGVRTLTQRLSIPRPATNRKWVDYCIENKNKLRETRERSGVSIRIHGYGVELKVDGLTIDFDWGDNGEPDGFDAWRLWNFRLDNCTEIECTYEDVEAWLATAYNDGELLKDTKLYYDPERRAS